jgi:hypothetical protein
MELDYQSILLQGYLDEKVRPYFIDYLFRQYQKARKEDYQASEFFGSCANEIQRMKGMVEAQCQARKIDINKLLVGIRSGEIKDDSGLEKSLAEEFSLLKNEDFSLNLSEATNQRFLGFLSYKQLRSIGLLIEQTFRRVDPIVEELESYCFLSNPEKLELQRKHFYEEFPNGNESMFIMWVTEFLEGYIQKGIANSPPEPIQTLSLAAQKDLLRYVKGLESNGSNKANHSEKDTGQVVNKTKEIIKEKFNEVDHHKGWKYIFRSETDFETYSELLSRYFDEKEYQIPTETIQVQSKCKTRLAASLGHILRRLNSHENLTDNIQYFKLVRVLYPFRKETDIQIIKAITREKNQDK